MGLRKVRVLEMETQEPLVSPWALSREERAMDTRKATHSVHCKGNVVKKRADSK